jgi:cytochrome c-type biogenesis protein CcsB
MRSAHAASGPDALTTIRHLAIQHNGREKPFDSFAWEVLERLTGSPHLGQEDPVETVLAILASPEQWQGKPLIAVPFGPVREALGMDPKATHVSLDELVATRKLMRMLPPIRDKLERDEKLSMQEQETWDVFERFVLLNTLLEQELYLVPSASRTDPAWLPILRPAGYAEEQQAALRNAWTALLTAIRDGQRETLDRAAQQAASLLQGLQPSAYPVRWRLRLEVLYNQIKPFRAARILYGAAFLGLLLGGAPRRRGARLVGAGALLSGFLIHGAGIGVRVVLGGRPPVSNFYETMLWLPFVLVLVALIFERVYRARYFGMAASLLSAITLLLADRLPLDPSLSPVVAVLRSNLWLTIHVLMVVGSYAPLTLALGLAHIYAALYLARRLPGRQAGGDHPALDRLGTYLYRAIQVGVVMLAGGIMLGAVWANASWGRYWAWDPKETWALITLLWFLAVLHGRFAGWLKGVGVALATIPGFFLLLMTYYGVSFYLVGLHSYAGGHAKPLPPLLLYYVIAEAALMGVVGVSALTRRRVAM